MGLMSYSTEFTFDAPIEILFDAVEDAVRTIKKIKSYETFKSQKIITATTGFNLLSTYGEKIEIKFQAIDKTKAKMLISSQGIQFELHQNKDNCNNIIYETKRVLSSNEYKELIEKKKIAVSKNSVSQDPYGELIKLKKLLDVGIISEIDFESKKLELLSQL